MKFTPLAVHILDITPLQRPSRAPRVVAFLCLGAFAMAFVVGWYVSG